MKKQRIKTISKEEELRRKLKAAGAPKTYFFIEGDENWQKLTKEQQTALHEYHDWHNKTAQNPAYWEPRIIGKNKAKL